MKTIPQLVQDIDTSQDFADVLQSLRDCKYLKTISTGIPESAQKNMRGSLACLAEWMQKQARIDRRLYLDSLPRVNAEENRLIGEEKVFEAIKCYRNRVGVSLRDARSKVRLMEGNTPDSDSIPDSEEEIPPTLRSRR